MSFARTAISVTNTQRYLNSQTYVDNDSYANNNTWYIPDNVKIVKIKAWGQGGANGATSRQYTRTHYGVGGAGGYIEGAMSVSKGSGNFLKIQLNSCMSDPFSGSYGYNITSNGYWGRVLPYPWASPSLSGSGGPYGPYGISTYDNYSFVKNGGGASWVGYYTNTTTFISDKFIIAGGGGGAGSETGSMDGGPGGTDGTSGTPYSTWGGYAGGGGTSGGAAGAGGSNATSYAYEWPENSVSPITNVLVGKSGASSSGGMSRAGGYPRFAQNAYANYSYYQGAYNYCQYGTCYEPHTEPVCSSCNWDEPACNCCDYDVSSDGWSWTTYDCNCDACGQSDYNSNYGSSCDHCGDTGWYNYYTTPYCCAPGETWVPGGTVYVNQSFTTFRGNTGGCGFAGGGSGGYDWIGSPTCHAQGAGGGSNGAGAGVGVIKNLSGSGRTPPNTSDADYPSGNKPSVGVGYGANTVTTPGPGTAGVAMWNYQSGGSGAVVLRW